MAEANPPANILYYKNGASSPSTVALTEDTRSVKCEASNELGKVDSIMQINFLKFLPKITPVMTAGMDYDVDCGLIQSNQLVNARAKVGS